MRRLLRRLRLPLALAIVGYLGYFFGQEDSVTRIENSPPTSLGSEISTQSTMPSSASEDGVLQDAGVPTPPDSEFAPTEESTVTAALRFLELTEDVVAMTPVEGAALQRSISTEASADRLAAQVEATLADVELSVPGGLTAHVAPLGTSARPAGDGWEVSVWYVEVLVYGDELAVEQWRTATYTVEWEAGEWRMADLVSRDGPTPVRPASTVASPAAELISETAGLSDEGWGS